MRLLVYTNASADDKGIRQRLQRENVAIVTDETVCDAALICLDGQEDMFETLSNVCRRSTYPVIALGYQEPANDYEEVRCLEMGADDYVRAGTSVAVLILRLQRMLRLYAGVSGAFHYWRGFLDLEDRQDYEWQGETLGLTGKEYYLFRLLLQNKEQMVLSEKMMEEIWQRKDGTEKDVLNTMIRKLRKKLTGIPFRIENCYGRGYALKYDGRNCNV